MNLVISIKCDKKGKYKGKYVVNIKEEGKGSSGGFVKYHGIYDSIEFNDRLWEMHLDVEKGR